MHSSSNWPAAAGLFQLPVYIQNTRSNADKELSVVADQPDKNYVGHNYISEVKEVIGATAENVQCTRKLKFKMLRLLLQKVYQFT